jgi:hypothetical protein
MQDARNDSNIESSDFGDNTVNTSAGLYPSDRGSADSIRAILKSSQDRSDSIVKSVFDKGTAFGLTDGKTSSSNSSFKSLADGIVHGASADVAAGTTERQSSSAKDAKKNEHQSDKSADRLKNNPGKPDDKPADKQSDKSEDKPKNPDKPGDKPADKPNNPDKPGDRPADKPGQGVEGGKKTERLNLDQGSIKDMAQPVGFKAADQKASDDNPPDDNVKTTVLQHQDKDKQDAKLSITKFGYYNQQPETVKGFNDFLDSIKKEDLGKEIQLTDKQMDQVYPALPNGIDPRPQTDHKFRVEEIGGKRVLVTESKVSGPDGKPEDERMKTTVYANPDAAKSTIDVISFEASNQDKDKSQPGVSNYSLLKPEAMKAISSLTWK